jgi:hypothetical protein
MEFRSTQTGSGSPRLGLAVSLALHAVVVVGLILWSAARGSTMFIAAGEGEGGEGGGGSIQVGVADPSEVLGFAKPVPLALVGKEPNPINNAVLEPEKKQEPEAEAILKPEDADKPDPKSIKTNRPIIPQHERPFTGKQELGGSSSPTAQVGHSFGNPTPSDVRGGIGIGNAGGSGIGTGLPGGSEYGRRIQQILSRNYNPPINDSAASQFAIILLRVSRAGKILSLSGGRVGAQYFKRRSTIGIVNDAAERAILASDPLPPFPAGFLPGVQDAVAEVWFRYPK